MRFWRYYGYLFNTILLSILLGIALALFFNVFNPIVSWSTGMASFTLSILLWESVRITRVKLFRVKQYNRQYGKTFTNEVTSIFKTKRDKHPLLDYHIALYYEVPTLSGGVEYIDRLKYYHWLARVWKFQNSPHRKAQESPLSHSRWEAELGGTNRFEAYMYILRACDAIDPESTYHVKLLRMQPWNIIIIADDILAVKSL